MRRLPWILGILMPAALVFALAGVLAAQEPQGPLPKPAPSTAAQQAAPPAVVYPAAQPAPAAKPEEAKPAPAKILIPSGTRLPLVLHNAISTRSARPGDPVYLETLFPIVQDNRVIIPAGSFVSGEVVEAKRPGRVKGRGELMIRLNTMILPNGYTINFNAVPTGAGTGGGEEAVGEGKIKGDTDKASDIGTVIKTTSIGAGIGALAGRSAKGAGIGAGVGAGVGLLGVLLSRGPEAELPRGTTLDVILDRPIYLDSDKVQFTSTGQASTLAGPASREPIRSRVPF
jgi:hypothetical protein